MRSATILPFVLLLAGILSAIPCGGTAISADSGSPGGAALVDGDRTPFAGAEGAVDDSIGEASAEPTPEPPAEIVFPNEGKAVPGAGHICTIYFRREQPAVAAAARELAQSLRAANLAIQVFPLARFFSRREPPAGSMGLSVAAGLASEFGPFSDEVSLSGASGDAYRFVYLRPDALAVAGNTPLAVASGLLALADRLRVTGEPSAENEGVRTPRFAVRAVGLPDGIFDPANKDWAVDAGYWRSFFGQLVTDRWNAVAVPAERSGDAERWQEVSLPLVQAAGEFGLEVILDLPELPDGESADRLSDVVQRAREAGARVSFRAKYQAPGVTSGPLTVLRSENVSEDARFYVRVPDGGAARAAASERPEGWRKPVYFWVPASGDPSGWEPGTGETAGVGGLVGTIPPNPYHLVPWGDPVSARETLDRMEQEGVSGVCLEANQWLLGIDLVGTPYYQENCRSWKYRHEKNWFRFRLWGVLAREGEAPDELLEALFVERYGETTGAAVLQSRIAASRILTRLTGLFPSLSGRGRFLEGCVLEEVLPRPPKEGSPAGGEFLSAERIRDLEAVPVDGIGVPERVGMEMADLEIEWNRWAEPLEVSEGLASLARDARESARVAYEQPYMPPNLDLARAFDLESQFMANLARFYAWQIETAVRGTAYRVYQDEGRRVAAMNSAREAVMAWEDVAKLAGFLYQPLDRGDGGSFHWKELSDSVRGEEDWAVAREVPLATRTIEWRVVGPFPLETRHAEAFERVLSGTGERNMADVPLPGEGMGWKEITVAVLEATPPARIPPWAEQVNRWSRFVNFRRAFRRDEEGAGFAWRVVKAAEASDATLEFPVGEPDKVWWRGELVYARDGSDGGYPPAGIQVRMEPGPNDLVFRVDRAEGKPDWWGAGPLLVTAGGPPKEEEASGE